MRQVGALHRAGPQLRHLQLEILAIVSDGATAPQASAEIDRLLHAFAAVVAAQPMADKFVLVVIVPLPTPTSIRPLLRLSSSASWTASRTCTTAKPIRILSVRI